MDLKSGYPFWTVKNGLLANFPPLDRDLRCDVAIIGAGITGALVARSLAGAGLEVAVLDKRDAGWGSTAASTALLQYEIDTELQGLAAKYGEEKAAAVYRACAEAIPALQEIAEDARGSAFTRASSLYYASRFWHAARLRSEAALQRRHGLEVELLERGPLLERFGIEAPAALLAAMAGHMDPYRLAIGLLGRLRKEGAVVCDRTAVAGFKSGADEVELQTDRGATVRARHLVIAAGYESQSFLRAKVARNHSSYALVTEPLRHAPPWLARTLVWETARPYLYLRPTRDGRLVMGGEDDDLDWAPKRDALVCRKSEKVLKKVGKLLPGLELEPAFAWAGTFAETADSLPFFGPHPELGPRVHFAMAYGGNGIVFSTVGAELLKARILGREHPLARFLSFERLT
jgi:glycine/D-amino acid oxidase-like deaminating enzyme